MNLKIKINICFYWLEINIFFNFLEKNLKKNKNFSTKTISKSFKYKRLINDQYDLIINSDSKNMLSKAYFSKRKKKKL